ncbi:MAG TPA: hypothetical protein VHU80_06480, partial [Polyangiaceae bacterium]|nr:hypothetical protein [Polyangiaceae bacterium]
MPYALGALTDSTGTITVHSATPTDSPQVAALSAIALRPIVAKDPARVLAFQELSTALQHVRHDGLLRVVDVTHAGGRPIAVAPLPTGSPLSRLLVSPESCARRFALEPSVRLVLGAA